MANLMPEVAALLGVEIGETFYILQNGKHKCVYSDNDLYKITKEGLANINNTDGCYEYHGCWRVILTDLLLGECSVETLPWEPKKGDIYYAIAFTNDTKPYIACHRWNGYVRDYASLQLGIIHKTEKEAKSHMFEDYEKLTGKPLSSR